MAAFTEGTSVPFFARTFRNVWIGGIILSERHLLRRLTEHMSYYHLTLRTECAKML